MSTEVLERIYRVVINDEGQYSIWPVERSNAPGWRDAGKTGTKVECLESIKILWTDMRPLSLRRHMDKESVERGQPNAVVNEVDELGASGLRSHK